MLRMEARACHFLKLCNRRLLMYPMSHTPIRKMLARKRTSRSMKARQVAIKPIRDLRGQGGGNPPAKQRIAW
jgi:hypothetical protein